MTAHATPTFARWLWWSAVSGAIIGAIVALLLLLNGLIYGNEGMEGSALIAAIISLPVTHVFDAIHFGSYADEWIPFIALAVPLNGALVGAGLGAVAYLICRLYGR